MQGNLNRKLTVLGKLLEVQNAPVQAKPPVRFLDREVSRKPVKQPEKIKPPEPNIGSNVNVCPRCKKETQSARLRGPNVKVGSYYSTNDVRYCQNCKLVLPKSQVSEERDNA